MQLLVRVVDKVNEDFYLNAQCTKRGDVIAVVDDAWQWGRDELTEPFFRILKHADMSASEASALLSPEPERDPHNPSRTRQARAFTLNLDAPSLPASVRSFLDDDTRATPVLDVTPLLTLGKFRALKTARPALPDPRVIG